MLQPILHKDVTASASNVTQSYEMEWNLIVDKISTTGSKNSSIVGYNVYMVTDCFGKEQEVHAAGIKFYAGAVIDPRGGL